MSDDTITILEAADRTVPTGTFLTVPEAAAASGLADRTIRRALREGRLAGATVGGRWTVDPSDLPRFGRLARRRHGTGTVPPGAGAAVNTGAQKVTTPEPVPDSAALVLAADVAALVSVIDTLTGRLEHAELEIAALRDQVAEANGPRRGWWARVFGGRSGTTGGAAGSVDSADDGAVIVDLGQAREDRDDRRVA